MQLYIKCGKIGKRKKLKGHNTKEIRSHYATAFQNVQSSTALSSPWW